MNAVGDKLVQDYLHRLDKAARLLPRREREELVAEIRAHVETGAGATASEVDIRNLLEELGTPESIVDAALPAFRGPQRGALEIAAILFLLFGGLLWGVGWIVGVVLVLMSPLWTLSQKLLAIFILPAGFAASMVFFVFASVATHSVLCDNGCHSMQGLRWVWLLVPLTIFLGEVWLVVYLYRAAGRNSGEYSPRDR